ncbi:hypothetical protein EON65_32700 [archaeon]|nr:MAG: hypothetical protein EON65_32700 [archaeon]
MAFGIDVNHLAIFAQSLRSTRSDAIVVLFIDIPFILKQKRYREVIVQTNLLCVYVDVKSSFQSNRLFRSAKGHKELRHFHPSSLRWILYDRLLNAAIQYRNGIYINQREIDELYGAEEYSTVRRWGSLFEKVLVLDVRDSMFQTDPFDLLPTLPPPPPTPSSSLIPNFLHRNSHSEGSYDAYNSSLYAYPLTHYATGNSAGGLLRGSLLESIGAISPTDTGTSTNTGGTHLDRFTLYGFSEDLSLPIASCGWNSAWIRDCFTDNILMLMQENYIVCSGVSMGYIDVVHIYVHYMSLLLRGKQLALNRHTLASHDTFDYYNYLNHIDNAYAINNFKSNGLYNRNMQDIDTHIALINENTQFPKCERNGVDQGMHNVLIYLNLIPVKLLHHYKFPVINVQAAVANFEFSIQNNTMYNIDNQFQFSIVHQYDRYTPFQNMLIERFVPWLNLSDPISEFNETMSCAVFNYVKDVDMLRGQCDLSSQRALSFATCCELCSKKNTRIAELPSPTESNRTTLLRLYEESTCTAFTFAGGTCFFKSCKYNQTLTAYLLAQDLDKNPQLMEPAGISAFIKLE